jgi:membrane-associated phospholipid phosphatase
MTNPGDGPTNRGSAATGAVTGGRVASHWLASRRFGSRRFATEVWLALVATTSAALFWVLERAAVTTIRGQQLDTIALTGNWLGRERVQVWLDGLLNAVSVASLILVLIVVGAIAVFRRRYSLAIMSVVLVFGSSMSTLVLKNMFLQRPVLGVDPQRDVAGNSFPSGHAAAAAAAAVGLVLVLPPAVRGVASVIGAAYAAVVGVATLSSGWHRPSDVVGAYLLVCGWAAFAGLLLVAAQRRTAVVRSRDRPGWSLATSIGIGVAFIAIGVLTLGYTFTRLGPPVESLSPMLGEVGYLGSAATAVGSAFLMMAVVLLTVHRVVPHMTTPAQQTPPAQHIPPPRDPDLAQDPAAAQAPPGMDRGNRTSMSGTG